MNPEPMAYESTAPPLSYLATMPKDITRNRPKSQLIFPIQIFINKGKTTFQTTKTFVRQELVSNNDGLHLV